jgi:hypothetical protein
MRVVLWCGARGRDVLQAFDLASLLDIVREIATRAKLHDEIYPVFSTLQGMVRLGNRYGTARTYHDVQELRNMPVRQALQDVDFALQVVE